MSVAQVDCEPGLREAQRRHREERCDEDEHEDASGQREPMSSPVWNDTISGTTPAMQAIGAPSSATLQHCDAHFFFSPSSREDLRACACAQARLAAIENSETRSYLCLMRQPWASKNVLCTCSRFFSALRRRASTPSTKIESKRPIKM